MSLLRRIAYMGIGVVLVLAVVLGGVIAFAQDGDEAETPAVQEDDAQTSGEENADLETQDDNTADDEAETEVPVAPHPGFRGDLRGNDEALLAEALGISVDELEAAYEAAHDAAIEAALAEGVITEEQAEQLRERGLGHPFGRGLGLDLDKNDLLAEALGISVDELEAARAEVRSARLAAMVEAGVLTQEEADLIAARETVQSYVDRDALAEMVQNAYEEAVAQALADGAITQAQADQLLEALSTSNFRFGGGFGEPFGRGGRGPHRGFHHGPGTFFAPDSGTEAPELDAPADA